VGGQQKNEKIVKKTENSTIKPLLGEGGQRKKPKNGTIKPGRGAPADAHTDNIHHSYSSSKSKI